MHGTKGRISEAAALAFGFIVRHVEMLQVKEALEFVMIGLDLSFARSAEEAMALSKFQ